MMSNDNLLIPHYFIIKSEIKNKGFALLDSMFKENGWHLVKNEMNWICYTNTECEINLFEIKIFQKSIQVSVPLKNSPFQFVTTFNDYFLATEYIEERFFDLIKKN